jgi:hypothetical protein
MVLPVSKRVMVADNGIAFVEDPAVAPFLPEGCGPVGSAFLHDLAKLETATLRRDLGQLLSPAQIEALAQRRDDLLAACGENNADWTVQKVIEMQPRPPG